MPFCQKWQQLILNKMVAIFLIILSASLIPLIILTSHIYTMINIARKLFSPFWNTTKSDSLSEPLVSSKNKSITLEDDTTCGMMISLDPNLRIFSFKELKAATRNFYRETVLGYGGFGTVYKGWIPEDSGAKPGSGSAVAVKMLDHERMKRFVEWKSDVKILGRLSHPNLEKLLGYGWNDEVYFLVYDFMRQGNLEDCLFPRGFREPLSWDIRVKILIGAARGLAFLHSSENKIVYRDFKSSNILIDKWYHARISDSGLARSTVPFTNDNIKTRVSWTWVSESRGYLAPEFIMTGWLTTKSGVYSFGVVLVEVMTGLRAFDYNCPTKKGVTDWIIPHLRKRGKLKNIIDPRLKGRYCFESAAKIAHLALTCLQPHPATRPTMEEVVETLQKIDTSAPEKSRHPTPHALTTS